MSQKHDDDDDDNHHHHHHHWLHWMQIREWWIHLKLSSKPGSASPSVQIVTMITIINYLFYTFFCVEVEILKHGISVLRNHIRVHLLSRVTCEFHCHVLLWSLTEEILKMWSKSMILSRSRGRGSKRICILMHIGTLGIYFTHNMVILNIYKKYIQGVFFTGTPPKKLKYGKPRLGESTLS